MAEKLGIYAPWVIYARQIEALFEKDSEIDVVYDNDNYEVQVVVVDNPEKYYALTRLLPSEKSFGNIILKVIVVNSCREEGGVKDLEVAFRGNEAFSHLTTISDIPDAIITNPITYCVFEKEVVQYAADDLGSESGMKSTLYENLARELLNPIDGVYYCTDVISG